MKYTAHTHLTPTLLYPNKEWKNQQWKPQQNRKGLNGFPLCQGEERKKAGSEQLTWLLQLCRLCSPNPFKGITTVTLGRLVWYECSSSVMSWQRNEKLWPALMLSFIRLISLFLRERRRCRWRLNEQHITNHFQN